jgi:hypothetical protein
LSWIVSSWSQGLDESTRTAFLNMQLKELAAPPEPLLTEPFASELSSEKQFELATGTMLVLEPRRGKSGEVEYLATGSTRP